MKRKLELLLDAVFIIGLVFPFICLLFLFWMRADRNNYLWVINGPYPFNQLGSGPFVVWIGPLVLFASSLCMLLSAVGKQALKKQAEQTGAQAHEGH
jgi:hypothetical protein